MKKRTDEEKLAMIDEACDLMTEAKEKLIQAKKLLHLCGVDCCDTFYTDTAFGNWSHNVLLASGIKTLEKITPVSAYFRNDYIDERIVDRSTLYIDYRGILFSQLGNERKSTQVKKYTFR